MRSEEVSYRLHHDPNFIALKRFSYSMAKLLERYPDGVPEKFIASALEISEDEVEEIYQDIVCRLRESLQITR